MLRKQPTFWMVKPRQVSETQTQPKQTMGREEKTAWPYKDMSQNRSHSKRRQQKNREMAEKGKEVMELKFLLIFKTGEWEVPLFLF